MDGRICMGYESLDKNCSLAGTAVIPDIKRYAMANGFSVFRNLFSSGKKKEKPVGHLKNYQVEFLKIRLQELMVQRKPYLKQRYSIRDMADDMQIPAYLLSSFLNGVLKVHFNDYLNRFRVEYCEDLMKNATERITNLRELAFKCGFNNRNTFTAAFKKFAGKTPSEYFKEK